MRFVNYTIWVEIVLYQILLTFGIGVLLSAIFTFKIGLTFMLGGGLNIIPGWLFGRFFFKTIGKRDAKKIINTFYYGEALKFITTAVLFMGIFQWKSITPIPLFVGFMVAQLAYWLVLVKLRN